jgi:CheY-like chemotaxis protein
LEKRLLWIDDDGARRYPFEVGRIIKTGYAVTWANSGRQAEDSLRAGRFDAVLLDQQLPWDEHLPSVVWGGVFLLAWLKGLKLPAGVPSAQGFDALFGEGKGLLEPHQCPVLVVSAFHDDAVARERRMLGVPDQRFFSKPIDVHQLLSVLRAEQ